MSGFGGLKSELAGELLTGEAEVLAYSYDASLERGRPDGVVIARSVEDVSCAVRWCVDRGMPYIARGAGTNLSGGCVPLHGGVVIVLTGLDRILAIDTQERFAILEPGVINFHFQHELEGLGWFYAPDPASLKICTLGGNAAENAGGPRCLKYGVTTNHIRALEAVMPDGSVERFSTADTGPEIMSLLIGSEGTLGIITKIWADILPLPERVVTLLAAFPALDRAMEGVSAIIAAGIVPRVLEAMDRRTVESIQAFTSAGYPAAEAVLLIEVEGSPERVKAERMRVEAICRDNGAELLRAESGLAERDKLWEGRRSAYAALARLAPNVQVEDGVVPRSRLPEAAVRIREISERNKVEAALLFHAGDGNLHPNMIFDERDREWTGRVRKAGSEILHACVELGGSISGEHGIGIDKREAMAWLFTPATLELMRGIKRAFDPANLANPGKLFPPADDAQRERCAAKRPEPTAAACSLIERVREKAERREELVALGAGTKAPSRLRGEGREVLSVRSLTAVRELDRANFVMTVEAGISMSELLAAAAKENVYLHLPLVSGTLGGLLATKGWAGLRGEVLGMRLLLADGRIAEVGANVAKSVAGYDVARLLLGSWGTLAIILEATLKLHARRGDIPSELPAPIRPSFSPWYRRLKAAFDPDHRLNGWVEHA
ncbi:MAG: FAD-linked oxidase C-terminal domain-containing protein [Elusimicrobiota bacterium]